MAKNQNSAKSEYQQQLVHLLIPGTYKLTIIQVTTRITDSPLLIPTASSSIIVNFISFYSEQFCKFVSWSICHQCENYLCSEHYKTTILLRVQLRAWNSTVFMNNNNHLVMPQNKTAKKSRAFDFDSQSYERNTPQFSMKSEK